MKKFLLSMAVMAFGASVANATLYNVNDATAIDGTFVEEVPAEGNKNGTAKHYQPLNSFKLGDYTITTANGGNTTATNQPAYYYNLSTSTATQNTVRLYKQNTITISSEVAFGKIVIAANTITAINTDNMITASVGGFTLDASAKTLTWTNSEAVKSVTFSMPANKVGSSNPQARLISFDISAETGDVPTEPVDPTPAGDVTIVKATEFVPGNYAFVFNEGVVATFEESKSYGYWMASAATLSDEMKTTKESVFSIASTDKGYTITDAYGRIMGWDGSHWSFNAYNTAEDGNSYWDVVMTDGKVKISNKTNSAVYLCGKKYNSDYEMCPTDRADQTLPFLYKVKDNGSGVAEVEAAENAEVVYYNLQGVKVAEPENGLYIKVQGNKATKVLIRK